MRRLFTALTLMALLFTENNVHATLVLELGAQDLTVECNGIGNGMSVASWLDIHGGALASSECGGVSWINDFSGLEYDGCGTTGEVNVTFTISDNCGNTISTTAVFKIEDTTPPYVVAAVAVEIPCSEYQPEQPYGNLEYADINGEVTVNFFDVPILGSECTTIYIRTYTATDVCDNTTSIQQYINLTGDLAPGCPDSSACNFDSNATSDDGSCAYVEGWWIPLPSSASSQPAVWACESGGPDDYVWADQACADWVISNDDFCDGIHWDNLCQTAYDCCLTGLGCTDASACNYDSEAGCDDGSCAYVEGWWIPLPSSASSQPAVWACESGGPDDYVWADQACADWVISNDDFCDGIHWDNLCQTAYDCCLTGLGCTDASACNYDSEAGCDDGSCAYAEEGFCDCDGNVLDALGDCGGECEDDYDGNGICDADETLGCTYPTANNYNPNATNDDGSCLYDDCDLNSGYDAGYDAGVASVECPEDDCPSDLNNDGAISTADLLLFLSDFGTICE